MTDTRSAATGHFLRRLRRLYRYFRGKRGWLYADRPGTRRNALSIAWAYARKGADA